SMFEDLLGLVSLSGRFAAHVALYDMWTDSDRSRDVRVSGTDTLRVSGKTVPAWIVDDLVDTAIRKLWFTRTGALLQTYDRPPAVTGGTDGYWQFSAVRGEQ